MPLTLDELKQKYLGKQKAKRTKVCDACHVPKDELASKRIVFIRTSNNRTQQIASRTVARMCADCIAAEMERQ